jgi:hypothetical protein
MGKPAVSRDAFRGLFAFYAAKAHHDHKPEDEHSLLKMFGSADDIPDTLLQQWSDRAELLGSETVGRLMIHTSFKARTATRNTIMPATFSIPC